MSDVHPLARGAAIAAIVFFASIGLGAISVAQNPAVGEDILNLFRDQIANQILSESPIILAGKIFLNNLGSCLLLFLGGASLGALTLLVLTVNGLVIGAVVELVRQQQGLLFVVAALVPHGIFEIPSFLLAGALGLLVGQALAAEWYGDGDAADVAKHLARPFVRIAIPLLAVAAVIEAFITPAILSLIA
jgi:stage II sporulation protein M